MSIKEAFSSSLCLEFPEGFLSDDYVLARGDGVGTYKHFVTSLI